MHRNALGQAGRGSWCRKLIPLRLNHPLPPWAPAIWRIRPSGVTSTRTESSWLLRSKTSLAWGRQSAGSCAISVVQLLPGPTFYTRLLMTALVAGGPHLG